MSNHSNSASARHHQSAAISVRKAPSVAKRSVESPEKVLAGRLRAVSAEKDVIKRSTLGLYSLKTKESSFGVPFCALSDALALSAGKQLLPISNVYKVGSFCLYNGKCSSLSRPVLVLDNKVS